VLPYRLLYAAYMRTCVGSGSVNYTLAFLQLQWRTTYKYSLSASLVPERSFAFLEQSVWLTSPPPALSLCFASPK